MRNLLAKELLFHKFNLKIWTPMIIIILVFYAIQTEMTAKVYLAFAVLMPAFMPIAGVAQEDKQKVMLLNRSLPVTPRQIVLAKYLGAWVVCAGALVAAILIGGLAPGSSLAWADLLALRTLLTPFLLTTIVLGICLPFVFRFGFIGMMVLLIGLQLAGTALLLLTALSGVDAFRFLIRSGAGAFTWLNETLGSTLSGCVLVATCLALNFVSYATSQWLLRSRDL